ncbi:MAG: hypothetical protein LUC37_02665 [Prevotella sp.]|nr:hypothetical protein [Prevotella sp.]
MTEIEDETLKEKQEDLSQEEVKEEIPLNEDKGASLIEEAIREQAIEDERPNSVNLTLRKILGGDFLTAKMLRNQIWLIIMIAAFTLIYVSNRYSCQKDIHEINSLKEQLKDAQYKALASSSELTETSRETNVLNLLKNYGDSILKAPKQPPYVILVPEK